MARKTLKFGDTAILRWYLGETVEHVISHLVDHGAGCPVRSATERLMALAEWTDEDLARAYFKRVSL